MRLDWASLKQKVKETGIRNSNMMAIAPTATIANIAGCVPATEPIYKNLYVKSNMGGEFTVMNEYLVTDLKKLGMWTNQIQEKIKYFDGSIQEINEIPEHVRKKYKEVFEIDAIWILRHAQMRGKWIDQAQSTNIFNKGTSGKKIADIYLEAWKRGLKTTYYLRNIAASRIQKSTIDERQHGALEPQKTQEPTTEAKMICSILNGPSYEACQ